MHKAITFCLYDVDVDAKADASVLFCLFVTMVKFVQVTGQVPEPGHNQDCSGCQVSMRRGQPAASDVTCRIILSIFKKIKFVFKTIT